MKRVFKHPSQPLTGKKYWRSLEQLAETPEFGAWLEREFPQGAAEFKGGEVSRRHFLKIMGASSALAGIGLSGCRRPELHLVPFTKSSEWCIPGKPLFYSTSMPQRGGYIPLIATTHDGRPTKLEGNPLHPISKGHGGTDLYAQASILDLYDPDRSRDFIENGEQRDPKKFADFLDKLVTDSAAGNGDGLAFLMEEDNSPTRERLRTLMEKRFPLMRWCVYEPLGSDFSSQAANLSYGPGLKTAHNVEAADVILALDSDFLGDGEGKIAAIKGFSARRRVEKAGDKMNRLYVVENRYTITGGMADHRLRCPVSQIGAFALALAERIAKGTNDQALTQFYTALPKSSVKFSEAWLDGVADDLLASKGKSLILVGPQQPVAVQLLVAALNSALENLGQTVLGQQTFTRPTMSLAELAKEIADKKIHALFIIGGNPVYNAPADLEWATLQKSVPTIVHVSLMENETSRTAMWHVPRAHYLEMWGDGRSSDGTYVSVQPMILPLFGGWSDLDVLARFCGMPKPVGPELVQDTFKTLSPGADFGAEWNKFLHDGFLAESASAPHVLFFMGSRSSAYVAENANLPAAAGGDMIEVVFTGDSKVDDGRYNNNGWLQELPDPITKMTWDNAALLSPVTAKKLGVKNYEASGDIIEIAIDEHRKMEAPIFIVPGHADNSISIALGYGRTVTGRVGAGSGVNVYPLRTTAAPYFAFAKIRRTGKRGALAITQDHWSMEGRALVREGTVAQHDKDPAFAQKLGMDAELPKAGLPSLYSHPLKFEGPHQWGMAIDLNTCLGCNACVVACQAENNTPIVGKEQVINGREMHWIRMDRYFASVDDDDADPEMLTQPMLCQQCENAPCETVCPVNATVHNDEGLNVMAYNRCIGTRYCANNCPFKVRRFNFFDYNQRPITPVKVPLLGEVNGLKLGPLTEKGMADTLKMQKNPNVTVRMRGVMEKCSFCVQRIQEAKIGAKVRAGASPDIKIPTDAFQVACQQACVNESIVFGNIADPESKVSKLRQSERGYRLLEYLNVNSRIQYLARLRNPNMKMPGADKIGAFEHEPESGGENPVPHPNTQTNQVGGKT